MFRLPSMFVMLLVVTPVFSASIDDLNLRVQELEAENRKIKSQHRAFKKEILTVLDEGGIAQDLALDLEKQFASNMKISGYADVEYVKTTKENDKPGFRLHHYSLFLTQKISDNWSLFSEIEFEDAPIFEATDGDTDSTVLVSEGKIFLEAMNLDFHIVPEATIRMGRFFTPAGIWSIDHYPPFVTTQERPQHIRKIFPQLIDGLMSYGRLQLGGTFVRYDLYMGNGENSIGQRDRDSHKSSGLRLALEIPLFTHVELGFSAYEDTLVNNEEKIARGYHIKVQWNIIDFQAEYATSDHTTAAGVEFFKEGYYTQLTLRFGNYAVGVRNDFYNDYFADTSTPANTTAGLQQYEKTFNTVYFNYRITKDIVFKLENHAITPDERIGGDYNLSIITIAVNLGN